MDLLSYEKAYRLLACRLCSTMLTYQRIKDHLQGFPHCRSGDEIKRAQAWASKLDIIQDNQQISSQLVFVPDDSHPIDALGEPQKGGYRCMFVTQNGATVSTCRTVGTSLKRIREHLKDKHGWVSDARPGRRSAGTAEQEQISSPWRSGVLYQRFFSSGIRSENFEVARGLNLDTIRVEKLQSEGTLQQAIEVFQSKGNIIRAEEARKIEEENDHTAPNPWLRRLGSAMHLRNFSNKKDYLRDLISMEYEIDPDDPIEADDAQLRFIHIAFDRLVSHAKAVVTPDIVSWNALFEVNRKELHKERTKPFHFRFKPETQRRYAYVVKQFFAYMIRAMSIENPADRPPFKVTGRQQNAYDMLMVHADDLVDIAKEQEGNEESAAVTKLLSMLEDDILELYVAVLDHFTKDTEYDSILVSFLTVLSIRADNTWEGYGNFTPKLSAIMAMSRLFIVKYAVSQRERAIKQRKQQGQSQEEAEENSPSHFALISEMTRRFMVGGGEGWETTPTQFIIRLRNFGMAANNNTAVQGSVSWDKENIIFKGTRLSVLDIQAMMRIAVQQAEEILYKDLLFCREFIDQAPAELGLPEIPWDNLLDNAADATIGYSFVDNLFQYDGGASKGWVIRRILQDEKLKSIWLKSATEGGLELNEKTAYHYGLKVEKALELLAFLAHMSGGFPPRAYELLTIRHRNTANGGVRNILVDQGLIMIVTGAHKGFSRSERLKIIHRFLPREVGALFVYFLWLSLRFWEDVQANVWGKASFEAGLWATKGSAESDGSQTDYASELAEPRDDGPRPLSQVSQDDAAEAGTRNKIVRRLGPGEHWTSPRLTRIIRRISVAACGQKLNISSWRHISIAIGRRYFRNASTAHARLVREADSDGSESESGDEGDSPYDLQAGHGSKIAGLIYGRLVTEGAFETNERRVNYRYISEEWHRLLGFPSAMEGFGGVIKPGHKRKNASLHYEALEELQLKRWKVRRRINLDQELCRLYGEQARFRGVQRESIEAIMMNKSPIVIVMGTGAGKSLGFMLPAASCPGGVTVVVVPLVSLQGDLMDRCRKMKIACAEWRSDQSTGQASLVFVTPESAMTKRFHDYIEGLRVMAQLDGFVFDEAHTILEGRREFRPRLRELGRLALIGVQMVYLTATLPPCKEEEFFELINTRRDEVTMIRSKTTRANVAYSVRSVTASNIKDATEKMTARVREILDEKLEEYPWPAKMIVYCQTIKATEALATEINCDAYHRDVDSRDGKTERLRAWMGGVERERYGGGRVIVATNALGLGIDVPDIRVVLHVEMPFEMADFAQQSGRAGRDGLRSEAIVVRMCGASEDGRRIGFEGRGAVGDYIGGLVCRRVALDSVMDGRSDREGCETGEEWCDVCRGAMDEAAGEGGLEEEREQIEEVDMRRQELKVAAIRRRTGLAAMKEAREVELFKKRLAERLLGGCVFCGAFGVDEAESRGHMGMDCKRARTSDGKVRKAYEMGLRMQAGLRRGAQKYGGCYECLLPQELCNRWVEDEVQGGFRVGGKEEECAYGGVMVSTIAYVYTGVGSEAEELFRKLGFREREAGIQQEAVWRWMGERVEWGGLEAWNVCRVFTHMAAEEEEG